MIADPYTCFNRVYERLIAEWDTHNGIVIGVDQDDTLYDYHSKGFEFSRTIDLLKRAKVLGCTLCAWTADNREDYIRTYWDSCGLQMDYFNDSPVDCGKASRKPYFNLLVDDRAGLSTALDILEKCVILKETNE